MQKVCFLLITLIASFHITDAVAVPAYPGKVIIELQGGSRVGVYMQGDEKCKWATTEDGYTLLQSDNVWYFAKADSNLNAVCSDFELCPMEQRSESLQLFLAGQSKNLIPEKETQPTYRAKSDLSSHNPKIVGNRTVLTILMSFRDREFIMENEDFDAFFNEKGYSFDGAQGSVYDYYNEVSYGQLQLHCDVLGPYTSTQNMKFYGGNGLDGGDANAYQLFQEAIEYASEEVNLANYDGDGDGYVDNIHIIFAGYGEEAGAQSNAIWSHKMSFPDIEVQGVKINSYSCSPELRGNKGEGISRIGACCHEIGHALGAADYYDTDYTKGGSYEGTGEWDVMAHGSWNNEGITPAHFNPYVKAYDFGWINAESLSVSGFYNLSSALETSRIFRINTPSSNDYYLLENRQQVGFDAAIPGKGLLIYHVHPEIKTADRTNSINATNPQMMYPICASAIAGIPSAPSEYGEINSTTCTFPGSTGKNVFGKDTSPAPFCWDKTPVEFELTNITEHEGNIEFYFYTGVGDCNDVVKETILEESFEDNATSSAWQVSSKYGYSSEWLNKFIEEGEQTGISYWNTISKADHGKGYMNLTNTLMTTSIDGIVESPLVNISQKDEFLLSFSYVIRKKGSASAELNVYTIDTDNKKEFVRMVSEPVQNWQKLELKLLPKDMQCNIMFHASINGIASVSIDNVSLTKISPITNIQSVDFLPNEVITTAKNMLKVKLAKSSNLSVITLMGTEIFSKILPQGVSLIQLNKGVYIVKTNDFTKRVLIP